ncbi:inactive glutathione S-transferase D3-like isoform X2 [Sitodiplosis mosellana]|nr:inactive glutathione S-transferase D3-like isoform X2 [Sitodiplosis mosellana]
MALSAIRCLGLDVEIREIDLLAKEQLKEDFIRINPQHTVPTLDDDGFILTESRAIALYLVEKYFPNGHSLYPKDVKQRALINQRLQFDCGTLYPRIKAIQWKIMYTGATTINEEDRQNAYKALEMLNTFLDGNKYLTGSEEPTLADAITFVSVTNVVKLGNDLSKFPNIAAWFERCKALPSAADNFAGAKLMEERVRSTLTENL